MIIVIRADGSGQIGGGHIMRCLTLARAAKDRGHTVVFVAAADPMTDIIKRNGFDVVALGHVPHEKAATPVHAKWLSLPWLIDAKETGTIARHFDADWVVVDHYGLDDRWADKVRAACPGLRILALDDIDDRRLGCDLLLDQTRLTGRRVHEYPATMTGPEFVLLRPEFIKARPAAIDRRGGPVRKVMIAPGMMDAVGLAPLALDVLDRLENLEVEVVMGSASTSRTDVEQRINGRADRRLTLNANDMAHRIAEADICIGAGGMTTWERCCLGLPTVLISVADNQSGVAAAVAEKGAAISLTLEQARDLDRFESTIRDLIARAPEVAANAARLCDGNGAGRVMDCLEGFLRPLSFDDARLLYDWRCSDKVRAASLNQSAFDFGSHCEWLDRTLSRTDGLWRIYEENGPVGFVSAVRQQDGNWLWSFYIGDPDATRGAGGRMLVAFLDLIWSTTGCQRMNAVVLEENTASIALHRKLGFVQIPYNDKGTLSFVLDRPQTCGT